MLSSSQKQAQRPLQAPKPGFALDDLILWPRLLDAALGLADFCSESVATACALVELYMVDVADDPSIF